ncbi:4598_t:CDS:2 [Rhizophagus irregularis]|nr:4598_t:CDS:2 [Rhizophagus irregularis]
MDAVVYYVRWEAVNTEKADLLVELNVKQQVQNISATDIVQTAWAKVDICGEQDLSNLLIICFFK